MLPNTIRQVYENHDMLVEMGGRPTRNVLTEPIRQPIFGKYEIDVLDDQGEAVCTVPLDANLTVHHWEREWKRFEEELDRWKEYRQRYQQIMEHVPLLKIPFDSENDDPRMVKALIKWNDWRGFQHYKRKKVDDAAILTWKTARRIEKISIELASEEAASDPKLSNELTECLRRLSSRQEKLETLQKQLPWIHSQNTEILSEACASLENTFPLQAQLELKLEQQAKRFQQ